MATRSIHSRAKTDKEASSSTDAGDKKNIFQGDEVVPLDSCLGSWVVVHDLIVNGTDEDEEREIESFNRSKGCTFEFTESQVTIGKAPADENGGDDHLEGVLSPKSTIALPSGRKVLQFEWNPPSDKTEGSIGYSDVWDFVKSGEMGSIECRWRAPTRVQVGKTGFPSVMNFFCTKTRTKKRHPRLEKSCLKQESSCLYTGMEWTSGCLV